MKRKILRGCNKILAALLIMVMFSSLLPQSVRKVNAAKVKTDSHNWVNVIENIEDPNMKSSKLIYKKMLETQIKKEVGGSQSQSIAESWVSIANGLLERNSDMSTMHIWFGQSINTWDRGLKYATSQYEAFNRAANDCIFFSSSGAYDSGDKNEIKAPLNYLPDDEQDVFYYWDGQGGRTATCLMFYNFKVTPIEGTYEQPDVEGYAITNLPAGVTYETSEGENISTVMVENRTDRELTMAKQFEYSDTTEISSTNSKSYTDGWEESTSINLGISFPFEVAKIGVTQSMQVNHSSTSTYEDTKLESHSNTTTDSMSITLPGNTKMAIEQWQAKTTVSIKYSNAVMLSYDVRFVSASCGGNLGTCIEDNEFGGSSDAVEDIYTRAITEEQIFPDRDGLDWRNASFVNVKKTINALNDCRPKCQYGGTFTKVSTSTVFIPQKIEPLYPLKYTIPSTEVIDIYKGDTFNLNGIEISALNEYMTDYYGFDKKVDGEWKVDVEKSGGGVIELSEDVNSHQYISAAKSGTAYIYYKPSATNSNLDANPVCERIKINVSEIPVTSIMHSGSIPDFILGDASDDNKFNGSKFQIGDYITLTGVKKQGELESITQPKWYSEETTGISVEADTGNITVSKPGIYHLYGVYQGVKSSSLLFEVSPKRVARQITYDAPQSNIVLWKGGSDEEHPQTFDLSQYINTIELTDQYGDKIAMDKSKVSLEVADTCVEISGNIIKAESEGSTGLQLKYETDEGIIIADVPILVTVKDAPRLNKIQISCNDDIVLCYGTEDGREKLNLESIEIDARDQYGNSFDIDKSRVIWRTSTEKSKIEEDSLVAVNTGEDSIVMEYDGIVSNELNVSVTPVKYVKELKQDNHNILVYENSTVQLDNVALTARNQYGEDIEITGDIWDDINWRVEDKGEISPDELHISKGELIIPEGILGKGQEKQIILTAVLPDNGRGEKVVSEYVILTLRQIPVLDKIQIAKPENLSVKVDQTILFSEFSIIGFDQYGENYQVQDAIWKSDNENVKIIDNKYFISEIEDETANITASLEGIESNNINVVIEGQSRLSGIKIESKIQEMEQNQKIGLSTLSVIQMDQYGNKLDSDAKVVWSIMDNHTEAKIEDGYLDVGTKAGKFTLVASVGSMIVESKVITVQGEAKTTEGATTVLVTTPAATTTSTTVKVNTDQSVSDKHINKAISTKKKIKLSWKKISNAKGYDIYVQKCNKKFTDKSIVKTVAGSKKSVVIKSANGKNISQLGNYKVLIRAFEIIDGKKVYISKGLTLHIASKKNRKYTNAKKVIIKHKMINMSVGNSKKIDAKIVKKDKHKKLLPQSHSKSLRYVTTNKSVALVDSKGQIKALSKGTCYVYAVAQNGISAKVKVTVS